MKKIWFALIFGLGFLFSSCEGCSEDTGRPGDQAVEALEEVGKDFEALGKDLEEAGEKATLKARGVGDEIQRAGERALDSIRKAGNGLQGQINGATDDDGN